VRCALYFSDFFFFFDSGGGGKHRSDVFYGISLRPFFQHFKTVSNLWNILGSCSISGLVIARPPLVYWRGGFESPAPGAKRAPFLFSLSDFRFLCLLHSSLASGSQTLLGVPPFALHPTVRSAPLPTLRVSRTRCGPRPPFLFFSLIIRVFVPF